MICMHGKFPKFIFPEVQKLLKPIYNLNRKKRQFIWEEEQQYVFEDIKRRFEKNPPILHLPGNKGRFLLYAGISLFAKDSALYQVQNGKPKFISICK